MSDELVKRLRMYKCGARDSVTGQIDSEAAADLIEQQAARIAELEAQIAAVAPAVDAPPVARVCVESLKPGQEFNTKYYGRVRFIRWDHYMGQRTAEIEKLDFGGRCNPLPETLQESIDACASAQSEGWRKDAELLDWLDKNMFHREMNEWDARIHRGETMWVMFAPNGVQGSARNVIDAALSQHAGGKDD